MDRINEAFEGGMEAVAAIGQKLTAVFSSFASAVQAAAEITATRWNLQSLLTVLANLATASTAISAIPAPVFGAPVTPEGIGGGELGDRGGLDPAAIKAAIIEGIQGSAIAFDLSLVQDPSQRAEFSFRLGRLERMFAEFVTRWEAAGA